ncbi:MAG: glutamate--cysteine ligase [Gammaproteobacteria bacterium]|nr:glutamate--cysteine ligase [Gammaproteobacteria bacterium]MDH5802846.1 glutamate--cysteine ligase [Gammaproteobacteria bacterium]
MHKQIENRINRIEHLRDNDLLKGILTGLEKESLRVCSEGTIAQTPHPAKLGAALTHPYITTDYSEALLELITPPLEGVNQAMDFLDKTHKFVYSTLEDEILWSTSMPCIVTGETSIPVAQYGSSNAGKMKTVYREGLGYRYGKMMQVIAGIHFNYSWPRPFWQRYQEICQHKGDLDVFISAQYFHVLRNLQRLDWIIPYLFGASPAICKSFISGPAVGLEQYDEFTYYQPYATSLRLGDIGYQNYKEGISGIKANYDSLDDYVSSLTHAIETPYPDYEKIGVVVNGVYRQLNANLLQIENEYYSTVRPKQIVDRNEKPSLALKRRGVRYIELRSLDLNVFEPLGVNKTQLHFLEALLLLCLFADSPPITPQERKNIDVNLSTVAHQGRKPGLHLRRGESEVLLKQWAKEIFSMLGGVCELMDSLQESSDYGSALMQLHRLIDTPELTPSARILAEMKQQGESFFPFSMRYSRKHYRHFTAAALDASLRESFEKEAVLSLQKQQQLEQADNLSFPDFLQQYFSQK